MGFAFARLGWSSAAFWSATPAELAAAISALLPARSEPLGRAGLDRLMAAFPDDPLGDEHDR